MKYGVLSVALLVALALFSACGKREPEQVASAPESVASQEQKPADPNFPCTVAGVTLESRIENIVSLNPGITEILFDMGLGERIAGVNDYDPMQELPLCGSEPLPNVEAILQTGAGAVLTLCPLPERAQKQLTGKGLILLVLEKPDQVEALPAYWESIACTLLGQEEGTDAAQRYAEPLIKAYEMIGDTVREVEPVQGVFAALLPLTLATGDSLQGQLLTACGIENLAQAYTGWQFPKEALLPLNPAVMVFDERTLSLEEIRAHVNYQTTACVTQGRMLGLDGSAIENGGRRLFAAMLDMARLAHPHAGLPEQLEALQ